MTMGKRQIVLAALVVALGAAVYLSWQFGDNPLIATKAVTSISNREYGQAQLANTSAVSGVSKPDSSSGKDTVTESKYFSEATLSRQKSRDKELELIEKVISDAKSDDAAKKDAVSKAATIAQNILKENNIESLIKAKGFSNCIVYIQNSECSVVVKTKNSTQDNAIVIKDIVAGQSGITYDKIKIIENK